MALFLIETVIYTSNIGAQIINTRTIKGPLLQPIKNLHETLKRIHWVSDPDAIAPAAGFNLGFTHGENCDAVLTDCRHVHQVHGVDILDASLLMPGIPDKDRHLTPIAGDGIWKISPLVSETNDCRIAVKTADCLPVLVHGIADHGKIILAMHAGWRGFSAGILENGCQIAGKNGFVPQDLRAVVGPAISSHRFEVGPEVLEAMVQHMGVDNVTVCTSKGIRDRWHVDLQTAAVLELLAAGIPPEGITVVRVCTFDSGLPSYRREGNGCGRLLSWIEFQN